MGVLAALLGGTSLIVLASLRGDVWRIVGAVVFVVTLVTLYTASTAYHAARTERIKRRLKIFDHCAIYLLIAGSYTPFLLNDLRGPWGWSLFGVIWGLAVAGITFKFFFTGRFPLVSTSVYLLMGWLVLVAAVPMLRSMQLTTLAWLAAGGIAYTAGTPFYHAVRMRYAHAVWHVFVLAGSACHAIAVATQL